MSEKNAEEKIPTDKKINVENAEDAALLRFAPLKIHDLLPADVKGDKGVAMMPHHGNELQKTSEKMVSLEANKYILNDTPKVMYEEWINKRFNQFLLNQIVPISRTKDLQRIVVDVIEMDPNALQVASRNAIGPIDVFTKVSHEFQLVPIMSALKTDFFEISDPVSVKLFMYKLDDLVRGVAERLMIDTIGRIRTACLNRMIAEKKYSVIDLIGIGNTNSSFINRWIDLCKQELFDKNLMYNQLFICLSPSIQMLYDMQSASARDYFVPDNHQLFENKESVNVVAMSYSNLTEDFEMMHYDPLFRKISALWLIPNDATGTIIWGNSINKAKFGVVNALKTIKINEIEYKFQVIELSAIDLVMFNRDPDTIMNVLGYPRWNGEHSLDGHYRFILRYMYATCVLNAHFMFSIPGYYIQNINRVIVMEDPINALDDNKISHEESVQIQALHEHSINLAEKPYLLIHGSHTRQNHDGSRSFVSGTGFGNIDFTDCRWRDRFLGRGIKPSNIGLPITKF
jgi:hypothetical protein